MAWDDRCQWMYMLYWGAAAWTPTDFFQLPLCSYVMLMCYSYEDVCPLPCFLSVSFTTHHFSAGLHSTHPRRLHFMRKYQKERKWNVVLKSLSCLVVPFCHKRWINISFSISAFRNFLSCLFPTLSSPALKHRWCCELLKNVECLFLAGKWLTRNYYIIPTPFCLFFPHVPPMESVVNIRRSTSGRRGGEIVLLPFSLSLPSGPVTISPSDVESVSCWRQVVDEELRTLSSLPSHYSPFFPTLVFPLVMLWSYTLYRWDK